MDEPWQPGGDVGALCGTVPSVRRGLHVLGAFLASLGIAVSASPHAAADTPVAVAARCSSRAFTLTYEPSGQLRILEYTYPRRDKTPGAVPTGRVLGYMDATTRSLARFCSKIEPRPLPSAARTRALAGPYARGTEESRVFCMKQLASWDTAGHSVELEMRPLLNRAKRQIGTRLFARIDSTLVLTATVTRRDGGYSFDYFRCLRNPSF